MSDHLENPDSSSDIEIYSVSLEQNGQLKLSRRDFLSMALAAGGTLLLLPGCQAAHAIQSTLAPQSTQTSTALPLPTIDLLAEPQAGSKVVTTAHANDVVDLLDDRTDLGWSLVVANGQSGWVSHSQLDFTRAFTREPGSKTIATVSAGTPVAGIIYVLLTAPGAPTPALPVTCPTYVPTGSHSQYYYPTYRVPTYRLPTRLPVQPYSNATPCPTVYIPSCGCLSVSTCPCLNYNVNPCPCVHFNSCSCLSYFPCTCQAYNPCSCQGFGSCSIT